MKAKILCWRYEKRPEQFTSGQGVQFRGHIDESADDRGSPTEAHKAIQMEGCNLSIVPFIICKVEMIRQRFLMPRKPTNIHNSMANEYK